jgi:acetyltransferase-like isoleucine patch superfamily enzyme
VIDREPLDASVGNRLRSDAITAASELVRWSWHHARELGAIGARARIARRFGSFGEGSIITFPYETLVNVERIHIGTQTMIARYVSLTAGWFPGQDDLPDRVLGIGDRCLIGRGSTVIAHESIEIGDDVWTGHHVHITDMNHGYEDLDVSISRQAQPEAPISIGDGSWLGHGVVVLPGSRIGRHVVVGAGSVVTGELPDCSVAVGVPAKVIRRHDPSSGAWTAVRRDGESSVVR